MIHLDRGHSSAIARHPKSNLILADPTHADQHPLLAWSAPTRNDPPFYQEHQEPYSLPGDSTKPPATSDPPAPNADSAPNLGPITPADTEDPKLPEASPSSPADVPSPAPGSSSSLTPPPDTATPRSALVEVDNTDGPSGEVKEDGAQEQAEEGKDKTETAEEVDRASRQSTPLSELSSAPDDDVQENEVKDEGARPPEGGPTKSETTREPDIPQGNTNVSASTTKSVAGASSSQSPREALAETSSQPSNVADSRPQDTHPPSASHQSSSASNLLSRQDVQFSSSKSSSSTPLPYLPTPAAGSSNPFDPKVVTVLELNNHLLSVLMGFQARGVLPEVPLHIEYASRLQSNLAWLAAAADANPQASRGTWPLPNMTAPTPVDFMSTERIQQLYSELPSIFAKEIARRLAPGIPPAASPSQVDIMNSKLKRDRPDELLPDLSHKRRDTGESKVLTPNVPAPPQMPPPTPHLASNMIPYAASTPAPTPNLQAGPSGQMGSPSMLPPSVPSGMMANTNEQMIAMRDRARQTQLRQAMQQQQQQQQQQHQQQHQQQQNQHQQQQQQHQQVEINRQMSPQSMSQQQGSSMQTMPGQNIAGPSSLGASNLTPMQIASLNQMGPTAVQNYQILQNHNHPLVQYLMKQVPGFMGLQLQHQLQHMQKAQTLIQQRQQMQNQRPNVQQPGGSSQGFMQPGMQSFPNAGMSPASMSSQSTSPTRSSPLSQQNPMQGQAAGGGFPLTNHGPNSGMDPRIAGLTPQQQMMFANMNQQQRQLLLVHQQQNMMRGGNPSNPAMTNPMLAAAQEMRQQQQRMAQVNMTHSAGSPIPGVDGSQFPALRSNPAVPGIARSTRTPSDSAPSPGVSQRISGHSPEDFQRAIMLQQAQQRGMTPQMQQTAGFPQMNWPQNNQQQMSQMSHMGHNQVLYGMSPPNSAGASHGGFGGMQGGMQGGMPSPAQVGGQNQWQQNTGNGQFPFVAPSSAAGHHHSDAGMTSRQTSATPGPYQQMAQNSPQPDQGGMGDLDIFNWNQ